MSTLSPPVMRQPDFVPTKFDHLVGDVDNFFAKYWATEPVIMRARCDLGSLISEQEIWDEVDCGLLSRPYFTMFNEGVRAAIKDITATRKVAGHEMSGYISAEQIRRDFAGGGTFKFNQAEHWHPKIRSLVQGMLPHFRGNLEAFVFLSPPDKTAMQAHTDGAHVFILQVAGIKQWFVGKLDDHSHSESTLHEGEIPPHLRMELTLREGDVLYMPHGCPHFATARSGNSVHVAITVEEPSVLDLANVYLAEFLDQKSYRVLEAHHHKDSLSERLSQLRGALQEFLERSDPHAALETAVRLRRQQK